jgi:REP element-mobilizing transposase RayT
MARPLRLEVPGGIYHITARANAGGWLFRDDVDRTCFLECYAQTLAERRWFSLSYCLMGTHYHLLVETPTTNLVRGMQQLNRSYAQRWHDRRGTHGHVFGGRYKSPLVQRDQHLLAAARYIARNPVAAGLCRRPEDWRWSAHRALVAGSSTPVLHAQRLLRHFGVPAPDDATAYRRFVDEAPEPAPPRPDDGILGTVEFARAHVPPDATSIEIPARYTEVRRRDLSELLARGTSREDAAKLAHTEYGYGLSEIARAVGVNPSTVMRWIRPRPRRTR